MLAEAVFPFYIIHQTIIVVAGWYLLHAGVAALRVIAGAGAPPAADCTETALAPNGWLILAPAG